jgi:hypothetical protein
MNTVEESSSSAAHSQKIKDTQQELERKITELKKEEDGARKENSQLKQQIS